tara:strand:- start:22856 stop:23026 length:171 start_codon:yes stop_codon:yes gene_type:complete
VYGYALFLEASLRGKLANLIFLVLLSLESTTGEKSVADSAEVSSVSSDIFLFAMIL